MGNIDKKMMFGRHLDNEEEKSHTKLTLVILLSNTQFNIQSLRKDKINYEGQKIAIKFLS